MGWVPTIRRLFPDRPLMIDCCSCAGGAAMGYWQSGFEVIGFDIKSQPNYPFQFFQGDAATLCPFWLGDVADAVHWSPPCQFYSITRHRTGMGDAHPALIEPAREIRELAGIPYVIENVEAARWALRNPIKLCGSSFGLRVRRHRLFESNVFIEQPECDHAWQDDLPCYRVYVGKERTNGKGWKSTGVMPVFGGNQLVGGGQLAQASIAMGINWMTDEEINESLPPAYTRHIGNHLIKVLKPKVTTIQVIKNKFAQIIKEVGNG
jgi:DNA (cytosine-5)-methyltransferase 1